MKPITVYTRAKLREEICKTQRGFLFFEEPSFAWIEIMVSYLWKNRV